jgi:phospholipid/cholesterol/gamma-HCH transport system substrate-binding protein
MERTTLDLWVGIFVVAGIAALVMLAMKVGNLGTYNVSESYQCRPIFRTSAAKPKASIKARGAGGACDRHHAGYGAYEAKVVMDLDKRYQFPRIRLPIS